MRIFGLALAGVLALTVPIVARAVPLQEKIVTNTNGQNTGTVQVWAGCGWGWHPVPGHWSRWRGGWVPPHCAPNHPGAWRGAYGSQGYPNGGWSGYGGGRQGPPGGWGYWRGLG